MAKDTLALQHIGKNIQQKALRNRAGFSLLRNGEAVVLDLRWGERAFSNRAITEPLLMIEPVVGGSFGWAQSKPIHCVTLPHPTWMMHTRTI